MSTSYDLDRKALKRNDIFLQEAGRLLHLAKANTRVLAGLAALLLICGGGFAGYKTWRRALDEKALAAFYAAQKQLETALHQASSPVSARCGEKIQPAIHELQKIRVQHKFTAAVYHANMLIGDTYFGCGTYASSGEYFESAAASANNRFEKATALYSAAIAHENAKNYDRALGLLRQTLASGVAPLKASALLALSRALHAKGEEAEAKKQLGVAKQEFPNSTWSLAAEELEKSWTAPKQ